MRSEGASIAFISWQELYSQTTEQNYYGFFPSTVLSDTFTEIQCVTCSADGELASLLQEFLI